MVPFTVVTGRISVEKKVSQYTTDDDDNLLGLRMKSIEKTDTVSEATDLDEVVTREAHEIGPREAGKRMQVCSEAVGLKPGHGLLWTSTAQ